VERSILRLIVEQEFRLAAHTRMLGFIFVYGLAESLSNCFAGRSADHFGRRGLLPWGWLDLPSGEPSPQRAGFDRPGRHRQQSQRGIQSIYA